MASFPFFQKLDKVLVLAVVSLSFFSLLELTGMAQNNAVYAVYQHKQLLFIALGIAAMFAVSFIDYRFFKNNSYAVMLLYVLSLVFLALLLVLGSKIKGATSWFRLGEFAFGPIEITKIAIVMVLAKYFSARHIEVHRVFHIVLSFAYVAIPLALILLQPDLGSAIIVFSIWFGILFFSGMSKKHIAILMLLGVIVSTFAWTNVLKPYQQDRILTFLDVYRDPQGSGYNVIQSMIAIGDGGVFGKGLGYGSQVQLGFLPESHTDFMFASIAEEFGFAGVALIFFLLSVIFWRITRIALEAHNNFAKLFCVGMIVLLFVQIVINMGMNLGIMPVTGIPFPFISYGGSSLISLFIGIGLVQSIRVRG